MAEIAPPPGSDAARERGCTCPVLDNGHGKGILGDGDKYGFVYSVACPIHGIAKIIEEIEKEEK